MSYLTLLTLNPIFNITTKTNTKVSVRIAIILLPHIKPLNAHIIIPMVIPNMQIRAKNDNANGTTDVL